MEKLVKNITRLIAHHNCVIIPGVGAFLAHKVPACYNATEKIFMPPHRSLGFNSQVVVDDALLLSEYMSTGKVSYEDASIALSKDIETLRSNLSATGVVRFGELGTFSMDIEGKIYFAPNENGIDDPYNYGYEPLAISPLSELKKKDIVIKRSNIKRYISVAAAVIVLAFVLVPFGKKMYEDGNQQISVAGFVPTENVSRPVAKNVEVVNIVPEEVYDCEIAPVEETATVAINTLNTETATEFIDDIVEDLAATSIVEPNENIITESTEVVPVLENRERHSIIVASTPNPKNAQLAITELSRKMKADYEVVEGDRRFRIAIETYDNADDANLALERIQQTFSDAWIYVH